MPEIKFKSQTGRDFVLTDGQTDYPGVLPDKIVSQKAVDKHINAHARGVLTELTTAPAPEDATFKVDEVLATDLQVEIAAEKPLSK